MTEKELFTMVGIRPKPTAPKKNVNRLKGFPWVSVVLMGAIVLCCLFAEVLMTKDPSYLDLKNFNVAPNGEFLFGTDTLGRDIFSASVDHRAAEDLLFADYKEFHIAGHGLAVAQITCVDSPAMLERKNEFLPLMEKTAKERDFDLVVLMLTDVLLEGTQILYVGDSDVVQQAFGVTPKENTLFLPQVMSRKKQVIPMLSALWG